MKGFPSQLLAFAFLIGLPSAQHAWAQIAQLTIDLSRSDTSFTSGHLKMGGKNPSGLEINANSRFLTRNGKPWLPVMGEFHFTRVPRAQWEDELLKMKAGGVDIVATYVFWIYHEEIEGEWNWSDDCDLRAFVQLCMKHGLYCFPRLGPWAHGEVRNGGFPDWLLKKCGKEVRKNAEPYMTEVRKFYTEIAEQLRGLMWKDGGPVIGIQIENELTRDAPHILALKNLARELGFDVPLYTMTGWMTAQVPANEVLPMSGGYPDAFWIKDVTNWDRRARKEYTFSLERDDTTIGADLGTTGTGGQSKVAGNPFLTCEMGGGMQVSYTRRPVIEGDDIAALATVKLGDGSNMLGYYMYHGGANAMGKLSTLNETKTTNYPNDLPAMNYDFQAPLGQYGQRRDSYDLLRLLHLFLHDFGSDLATMPAKLPDKVPRNLDDTETVRWSARSDGECGFIFVNNYQRIEPLPEKKDVLLQLKLKHETLTIPSKPITIPKNVYAIWPFNMNLNGVRLKFATAQPLCKVGDTFVFFAQDGVKPEFVWEDGVSWAIDDSRISGMDAPHPVTYLAPNDDKARAKVLVLTPQQAQQAWRAKIWGADRLFLSDATLVFDGNVLHMQSREPKKLKMAFYPPTNDIDELNINYSMDGTFGYYTAEVQPRKIAVQWKRIKPAAPALELKKDKNGGAVVPDDSAFDGAEVWQVTVPKNALDGVADVVLRINYTGDIARAYIGDKLIDDDFYFGRVWEIGLKRFAPEVFEKGITLKILPLRKDAPVYIPKDRLPEFDEKGEAIGVKEITAQPEYEVVVRPQPGKPKRGE